MENDTSPQMSLECHSNTGVPIRRNVTQMSARYNGPQCSSELLLATEDDTALYYLRRDPSGRSWTEDRITRKGSKSTCFDAFVTTLVLTNGLGKPVPPNYPVKVTSEPLHIVANDKSYSIGSQETTLVTDNQGSILIAIPANGKIACPFLKVSSIGGFSFDINPAQRVDRLLGKLGSAKAPMDATSANGNLVFDGCSSDTLSAASSIFGKYEDIKSLLKTPASTRSPASRVFDLSGGDEKGSSSSDNWFDKAVAATEAYLGDYIDNIKLGVQTVVRLAIRFLEPGITLIFKTGSKIVSFALKQADSVLSAIGNFMENQLGIDLLNRVLDFMRAMYDPAIIKSTQDVSLISLGKYVFFKLISWLDSDLYVHRKHQTHRTVLIGKPLQLEDCIR